MKKVELRMNELKKYNVIKKLYETNGNKKRAALELDITTRQINRLLIGYAEFGKEFFIHKNRGRKPSNYISQEIKNTVIDLYTNKYWDCNYSFFTDILNIRENINISESVVRNILLEEYILSPKSQRKTKKKIKQQLKIKENKKISKTTLEAIQSSAIDNEFAHPLQPRSESFGEELQMDACNHLWFSDFKTNLHIAIDDATGMIVGMYFDKEETLNGYYQITKQFLSTYGIPYLIKTDNRTVFKYNRLNSPTDADDTLTQYAYACKQLGIKLETSSQPEFKPRVERAFNTLQGRLTVELRLANINTIEDANTFLKTYLTTFNEEFALPLNNIKNVWDNQVSDENIDLNLAILCERVIDKGHSVRYNKKNYKTINSYGNTVYYGKGTKCIVIKTLSSKLYACIEDIIFELEEIPLRYELSPNFNELTTIAITKRTIPDMLHYWRKPSFDKFVAGQKHRNDKLLEEV